MTPLPGQSDGLTAYFLVTDDLDSPSCGFVRASSDADAIERWVGGTYDRGQIYVVEAAQVRRYKPQEPARTVWQFQPIEEPSE
jgi:hypothetical protein